jgi:hypothetical protein
VLTCGAALSLGCLEFHEGEDAKVPGDEVGTFQVQAKLRDSSCGSNALGSKDTWEFPVRLSRDGSNVYWLNGREVIAGELASDGRTFDFDTVVSVTFSEAQPGRPGCRVARRDRARGVLADASTNAASFAGRLRYEFEAEPGSDCSELMLDPTGLAALPCVMEYSMRAARVASAEPSTEQRSER